MSELTVTVCDSCRTASCWHGKFMCDRSSGAGTIDLPLSVLQAEAREHPENWDICPSCFTACQGYCERNPPVRPTGRKA